MRWLLTQLKTWKSKCLITISILLQTYTSDNMHNQIIHRNSG